MCTSRGPLPRRNEDSSRPDFQEHGAANERGVITCRARGPDLMWLHKRVDSLRSCQSHQLSCSLDVSVVDYGGRVRVHPRPHHPEADQVDAKSCQQVHVGLDEAEVAVEVPHSRNPRSILVYHVHPPKVALAVVRVNKALVAHADGVKEAANR